MTIHIVDRKTEKIVEEKVYGKSLLQLVYRETIFSKFLCILISKIPIASSLFGLWQKTPFSKKQVAPFIEKFGVLLEESEKKEFTSFNDFFIRKLKKEARPIAKEALVAPADGRYLVYNNIQMHQEIWVKGKKLSLSELLDEDASRYLGGALVMARLAPPDYHRFHFPIDCIPSNPRKIHGHLFSVNPIALRKNISYLSENKRVVINLGRISYIAIGATNVGSIHFTYTPGKPYKKGDELGYFSFGASMIILLIEPNYIHLASDLLKNTASGKETLCYMGESIVHSPYADPIVIT